MAILIFQADCLKCAFHTSPCLICKSVFFQNLKLMIVGCVSTANFITTRAHFTISMALSQKHEKHEMRFVGTRRKGERRKKIIDKID